jgi:hypothetical protein
MKNIVDTTEGRRSLEFFQFLFYFAATPLVLPIIAGAQSLTNPTIFSQGSSNLFKGLPIEKKIRHLFFLS